MTTRGKRVPMVEMLAETYAVRDDVLRIIESRKRPVHPRKIFALIEDEYGPMCERRLWRTLRWLTLTDKIAKVGHAKSTPDQYGYVATGKPGTEVEHDRAARRWLTMAAAQRCYTCEMPADRQPRHRNCSTCEQKRKKNKRHRERLQRDRSVPGSVAHGAHSP